MWQLFHLGSAIPVAILPTKEEAEYFLYNHYFFLDPKTTALYIYDEPVHPSITLVKTKNGYEFSETYKKVPLNPCEFEIFEVADV